ncbi:hypothetical protein ABZ714_27800 [Streptomyces sp. NPDC006798]|uniref:hypothetical protein n=1 Tax=Streptomyces sp. NPDC006798 TaxID=3155462 RepID=UPI0033E701B3
MFRRREAVPFSFVARAAEAEVEAERFRSNVTPPPRERPSVSRLAGRTLIGLTIVGGLAGALLFGLPAMESGAARDAERGSVSQGEAAERR